MAFLGCTTLAEAYVYATCVLLGISMLMPLNALFSAPRYMVDYYKYVTGNPDAEPSSEVFWANILTFYNVASVTTQIVVGPTILLPFARKLSLSVRFTLALLLMTSEVATILIMPVGQVSQGFAIAAFFIVSCAAGAGKSYLEATCYALASSMDPKFMSAVMFGCGFSGVITSVLQCIVKATMGDSYDDILKQSYIYFSLAICVMMTSLMMALSLRWNSYARIHVAEFRALAAAETGSTDTTPEVSEVAGRPMLPEDVEKVQLEEEARVRPDDKLEVDVHAVEDDECNGFSDSEERGLTTAEQLQRTKVWPVIRNIYPMQIACFTIFFVSLFIFPSLVIPIDRDSNWFATLAILCYNCGDATGRLSSSFPVLWPSRKVLLIVAFCRVIFVPLIFLCIFGYIPGHAPAYVLLVIIGLTKGFFGATSMVFGATTPTLTTPGQRVMAGQLMGISLLAGASFASLLALLVVLYLPQ